MNAAAAVADDDPALRRLRADYASLRLELAMLRFANALKYDPDQPRVPAGSPDGGQWTSDGGGGGGGSPARTDPPRRDQPAGETGAVWRTIAEERHPDGSLARRIVAGESGVVIGSEYPRGDAGYDERHTVRGADGAIRSFETSGAVQTVYDENGRPISRSVWTGSGPQPAEMAQSADFSPRRGPAREAIQRTIELGASLFTYLSGANSRGERAVMGFVARDYREGEGPTVDLAYVGMISQRETEAACPRFGEVQSRLDAAATAVRLIGERMTPATYGTAVHMNLKAQIDELRNENFRAEVSLLKSSDADSQSSASEIPYGTRGSIRIDVLERVRNGTVCVYDVKTGASGLLFGRSEEIARSVYRRYIDTRRIIVVEVKQTR